MNINNLKLHIKNLSEALDFFTSLLNQELAIEDALHNQKSELIEKNELRKLLTQEIWPKAVSEDLICSEELEDDKLARAAEICKNIFKEDLEDAKILDFGCGEGHCSYLLATLSDSKFVMGYDKIKNKFESAENLKFSQSVQEVEKEGPYDVILMHDVIDHCENPEEIMSLVKKLKKENGKIFLRCHPWTSRHGSHLYKQKNKAYIHLIFSEDELYGMGIVPDYVFKINNPLDFYKSIFIKNNFKVITENIVRQPFDLFFLTKPSILKRMRHNLGIEGKIPTDDLEIQFVDYLLE